MTLPAVTPDPLGCGRWRLRALANWGNDFAFSQTGPAESPHSDRRFLIDGEHVTLNLEALYGVSPTVDVGVRIPLQWRGGGIMDGLIDWFHGWTHTDDNARPEFFKNKYRVEGRTENFQPLSWTDDEGFGLGNVELEAHWAFLHPRGLRGWRASVVGRMGLPTGTHPFDTGSVDLGAQVAVAKRLHRRVDLYGGLGGTWFSDTEVRGFEYEPWRFHAFLALEWRALRRLSFLVQSDYATRLVTNLADYPAAEWYLQVGTKVDLDRAGRTRFILGITEGLIDQQSTTDFAMWTGLEFRF